MRKTLSSESYGAVLVEMAIGLTVLVLIIGGMFEYSARMQERQTFAELSRQLVRLVGLVISRNAVDPNRPRIAAAGDFIAIPDCCQGGSIEAYYKFNDLLESLLGLGNSNNINLPAAFGLKSKDFSYSVDVSNDPIGIGGQYDNDSPSCAMDLTIDQLTWSHHHIRYQITKNASSCVFCKFMNFFTPEELVFAGDIGLPCRGGAVFTERDSTLFPDTGG